ncbi:Fanconi anemia group M protein-like [Ptychodera flava]|uniref:Fanconi anemia group M protein-like n=1 Tax=Ptychodera flava TaxID=63121 RepID=UPI00396A5DDC
MSGRAAKQTTLFQSWGRANSASASERVGAVLSGSGTGSDQMNDGEQSRTSNDQRIDGDGDFNEDELLADFNDDELLAAAAAMEMDQISTGQEWNSYGQISNSMSTAGSSTHYRGSDAGSSAANDDGIAGFDHSAGNLWIYPTNYPIRDYQYNIVQQALFKNTMVTLPTGLGKTFIAAVVMYNFYRWYAQGKIAFMAPTKPLVAQQIEACYNIMGIPQDHTAEMTGSMPPTERLRAWKEKRVFFLTPQVMMNDLSRGACPSTDVKCLVIDEAHKALGNHAYCQVVRELVRYTQQFRVLALSATPGGDIKGVQQVLNNLLISHVEIRSEESIDIQPYVHERKVEKMVVKLDEEIKEIKDRYVQILSIYVNRLIQRRVLYKREVTSLSKFMILKAREDFRCNPPTNIQGKAQQGMVEGDFAMSISLYHGYELLLQHGMRSLYSFLQSMIDGSKGSSRARSELSRNPDFISLLDTLRDKYQDDSNQSVNVSGLFSTPGKTSVKPTNKPFVISHPKMGKLREVVLEHFHKSANTGEEDGVSTRIMIFSQYRDSVQEITDMLNQHQTTVQVMSFIGQASAGKNTKGFSQKEQLRVVKAFRQGGYNTLVSTCVGEEGLDIGDVDLIICYDAHKSPIRLVQRMGRTGRKRQGRIVMLVTEGKEESIYNQSQLNKKSIHRAMKGNKSLQLYPHNPRMIPHGINPVVHKMHITMDKYQSKSAKKKSMEKKRTSGGSVKALFAKGRKMIKENGFLSEEELQYWNDHYKVSETVKQLPTRGKITCLAAGSNEDSKKVGNVRNELSLTEWKEWQNTKQATKLIAHSKQCCNFVELMEFIELQQQMGDEDNYGLEMMAYLNMDDVVQPGKQKKYGIEQYYIADNPSDSKGNAKEAQSGKKLKKRACVILDSSDSDDDLPDAEMKRTIETGKKNVSNTDLEFGKMKDKKEKKCNSDKKKKSRSKKAGNKAVCVTPIITDTQSDFEIDRCNISDEQVKRKENKKISNDDTAHQMKERDNETSPLKWKGDESDRRRSDSKIDIEIGAESKNDNNTSTDRQRRKINDQDENVKGLSSSDLDLSSIFPSFSQRNSKHNSVPVNDKDGFVVAVPPSLDSLSDLEDLDFPESTLPGFRNGSEMEDDELTNESNNHAKELEEEEEDVPVDLKKENFGEKFQNPTDTLKKTMTQAVPSSNQICENLKFDCDEKEFSKEVFISKVKVDSKDNSKDEDRISQIDEDGDMFDIDVEDNDEPDCVDILTPQVTVKLAESSEDMESTVKVAELDKDHVGDTEQFGKDWQEKTMDSLCVSKSQIQVDKVEQTEHQIKNRNSSVSWTPGKCNSEDIPPANTSESRSQPIPDNVKDSGVGELKYKNTDRKDCCNNDNSVNIQSKDQNCPLSQQTYSKCVKNNMESTCMTIGPSHSGMECYASTARKEVYYREHQTLDGFEPNFDLKFDFSHLDEEHNELVDVVPPSPSNKPSQSIWLKSSTGITKTMNKAKKLPLHSVCSTNKYKQLQFTNATHTQPPVKQNDSLRKGHVKSSSRQHWISLNTSPENTSVLTNNQQLKSDKQSKRPLNSKKSPTGGFAALSVGNFENEQSNISLQHRSILKRKSYSPTVDKLKSDSYKRRKSSSPIGSPLFTASSLSKTPDVHTVMKDSPNTPCTGMAVSPVNSRNKSSTPLGRVLPSRVESVISPIEITKTPTTSKSFDSDSDDSIVGPRKKKKANVLWSPDTPTVARKPLNGASSVDKKQRTKRTPITPLFSAVIDSEDEFVDPVNAKSDKRPSPKDYNQYAATKDGTGHERKRHSSEFSKGNKISKKAKRKHHDTEVVRGFLDEEAEVSDDIEEYSSDENGESDEIDTSLEEFINDATQISPDCTNMRQIYAQSLHQERGKSMAAGPVASRYKMVYKQHVMMTWRYSHKNLSKIKAMRKIAFVSIVMKTMKRVSMTTVIDLMH